MAYNRISGRIGQEINLDVSFYRNGILTDPYAIKSVEIYKGSTEEANKVMTVVLPDIGSSEYPYPVVRTGVGKYNLYFDVPTDFTVPDIYFDVWTFVADGPGTGGTEPEDLEQSSNCNKFWLYPDGWFVSDNLMVPKLGFEPMNVRFRSGEKKYLEVGMMPLPLYDYDYNLIMPLIPYLNATISMVTRNCEVVIDGEPMTIGIRQGAYRSNPFVLKYLVDTSRFLIGTYDYYITVIMPDGQTLVSPKFTITIS